METVKQRGLSPEQKRLFYHLYLTLLVAAVVAWALHKPSVLFMMLLLSWGVSILTFRVTGYVAITRGVLTMGVLAYVVYRFVFPDLP
jgi:hypothetical protein